MTKQEKGQNILNTQDNRKEIVEMLRGSFLGPVDLVAEDTFFWLAGMRKNDWSKLNILGHKCLSSLIQNFPEEKSRRKP